MMISFIIPAYNEALLLRDCLESIKREVRRFGCLAEIIVVDNNSTDSTRDIAYDFGATIVLCNKKGLTLARQAGFLMAKYEFQAYIDADNVLPVGWLDHVWHLYDHRIVAISGPPFFSDQNNFVRAAALLFFHVQRIANRSIGASIQGGNFVTTRTALTKIGGHSVDIAFYGEDTDLAKRLSRVGSIKLLPKMWIYSSSRRFRAQGFLRTTYVYILNYLSVSLLGKPVTLHHDDFRT